MKTSISMKKPFIIILAIASLIFGTPATALAFDWPGAYKSNLYKSQYYDPNDLMCGSSGGPVSADLIGNDNIEIAFNYFIQMGLTAIQSAGIVGNLRAESTVNPSADQEIGGDAKGIAQWEGDRYINLLKYATERGKAWNDLGLQLDFLWKELTSYESESLAAVKAATTIEAATSAFMLNFERPLDKSARAQAERAKLSQEVYDLYGKNAPAGGTPGSTAAGGCLGGGGNSQYVDGFAIYSQYDPAWKDKPYGSSTIGEAGCGPSAMAMIITALTNHRVTPDVVAPYAASQGMYIPGVGSSWDIPKVVAPHWGLKARHIGADVAKITATLQAGGLVIGSGSGPLPFTSGGHYIVIRAVTADGKWLIGDSGHTDTNKKSWDPKQIVATMNDGSAYAVTK